MTNPTTNVTKINRVSELTKDIIANLYFGSLSKPESRHFHPGLAEVRDSPKDIATNDLLTDFHTWYGGFVNLANAMGQGGELPAVSEMSTYITQNVEKAKQAIAA